MGLIDGAAHFLSHANNSGLFGPAGYAFEKVGNNWFPVKIADRNELEQLFQQGMISSDSFKDLMRYEGYQVSKQAKEFMTYTFYDLKQKELQLRKTFKTTKMDWLSRHLLAESFLPNPDQIILLLQRKWITLELAHFWLQRHGMHDWNMRKTFLNLKDELPTSQDLIQFSVRHGFEPDILQTFGYNKEIPATYLKWAEKIGLGGSSEVTVPNSTDALGNTLEDHEATWAEQHWFAHWILPSLGDAYEMLHRLYPKSDYGPSPDFSEGNGFTPELLALFQRAQDIPQYWRQRLQAISYIPLSRVDVRRMYNAGTIEEKDVYHSYRAQGYNDTNAKRLLKFAIYSKRKQIEKEELWPKAEKLCQMYSVGLLDSQTVLTYTDKLEIPRDEAQTFINNCNLENKKKQVDQILKLLKRAFVKGVIDETEVTRQLNDLGIREDAINDYILQWTLEKQFEFKEDNASEAQKWYMQGIITQNEFVTRLQNLGILPGSVLRMVQSANVTIAERIAKEQTKLAKELEAKAKEIAREQKAQNKEKEKEQKDIIKRMLASSTQVNLKKWYKEGLITIEEVSGRLAMLDYSQDDIDRWLAAYGS